MKNFTLALLLIVGVAPSATAGGIDILSSPYRKGVGGEFTFEPEGGWLDTSRYSAAQKTRNVSLTGAQVAAGRTSFQTFCIETNEYIDIPQSDYIGVLNTQAVNGGSGGPSPDTVSKGTGWLYSQFARGVLAGYNYSTADSAARTARKTSAEALQLAIWWLEQEWSNPLNASSAYLYNPSNIFMKAAYDKFGGETGARADGAWLYGVKAINMTRYEPDSTGNMTVVRKQDGLALVPDGGTTLLLLGGALVTLGAFRRRLQR